MVCSDSSIYLKTLGGFSPFFNCVFLGATLMLFLFLSAFSGGGCCPMVILGISLNLGAKGGANSCLTLISSGMGGN